MSRGAELREMAGRLLALADEADRETPGKSTLQLFAIEGGTLQDPPHALPSDPAYLARFARSLLHARRMRERLLPADLFAEPAWDMLLELFVQRDDGRRFSVTDTCSASNVPPTTALRWLEILVSEGLVERISDATDGRRRFIQLTPTGERKLSALLGAMHRRIISGIAQPLLQFGSVAS